MKGVASTCLSSEAVAGRVLNTRLCRGPLPVIMYVRRARWRIGPMRRLAVTCGAVVLAAIWLAATIVFSVQQVQ